MDSADGHHQMRRRDAVPAGDGHAPAPTTTGGDGRPVAAVVVPVCSLAARAAPAEVDRALRAVANGEVLLGPDVAVRASSHLTGVRPTGPTPFPELTDREREVLDLGAAGLDNGSIARRLALSPRRCATTRRTS